MMNAQTAAELRRELAPYMRDGSLSPSELVNYLFSREAAQGYSAPLARRAVDMAEAELIAQQVSSPRSNGDAAIYGYADNKATREAINICRDLVDAGVIRYATTDFRIQFQVTAASRRPLDRVADRFGF